MRSIQPSVSLWLEELALGNIEAAKFRIEDLNITAKLTYDKYGQNIMVQAAARYAGKEETSVFGLHDHEKRKEFLDKANELFFEAVESKAEIEMLDFLGELPAKIETNRSTGEKKFRVSLTTGSKDDIIIRKNVVMSGITFKWFVEDQAFSKSSYAKRYLKQLIIERVSGYRVLMRKRQSIPEICGVGGSACRAPNKCNTNLCSSCCPIAENFFATRDGVNIRYAIRDCD